MQTAGTWGFVAWLVWLAVGCGSDATAERRLEGRAFLLTAAEGFQALPDTKVRLSFQQGQLGFGAGCNSFSGSFALRAGRLVVTELGSTEIGCDAPHHAQDMWLAAFLSASPRVLLGGDQLTLTGVDATLVFLDREIADPDRPLVGTPWSIDTFIDGDAASNFPLSASPTILFRADGSLQVDTTCNIGTGSYSTAASRISLSNVAYTEKACSGASSAADTHIQAVVRDGMLMFTIEAARLTLQRDGLGLSATRP